MLAKSKRKPGASLPVTRERARCKLRRRFPSPCNSGNRSRTIDRAARRRLPHDLSNGMCTAPPCRNAPVSRRRFASVPSDAPRGEFATTQGYRDYLVAEKTRANLHCNRLNRAWARIMPAPVSSLVTRISCGPRQLPRVAWYVGHSLALRRLSEATRREEGKKAWRRPQAHRFEERIVGGTWESKSKLREDTALTICAAGIGTGPGKKRVPHHDISRRFKLRKHAGFADPLDAENTVRFRYELAPPVYGPARLIRAYFFAAFC